MLTTDEEKNKRAESILHDQMEYINTVQKALRELNIPESVVQEQTMVLPDFTKLLPDQVEAVYQQVKFLTINYYDKHGFSQREISRRLKGESHVAVRKVLKNEKRKQES